MAVLLAFGDLGSLYKNPCRAARPSATAPIAKLVTNLSIVSLPLAQPKELIPRKAAIGNCYLSLDNT